MNMKTRVLTGINTTGSPHLGNYVGAIRPALRASHSEHVQSFYFLADYHSLIKCQEPARVQRSTLEIAACWLAAGLDPDRVTFYRQSDIAEIPQLCWLLTCVTGKGQLNRAHAYKAAQDKNAAAGREADEGVSAGLCMYPVLMAADILMFSADKVPVGRDQVQHIEMCRDMAASFNHLYGNGRELLHLPEALVDEHVALLPGLDGRKMSKSYDNTITLFGARDLMRRQIMSIVTDSRAPGEPKQTEGSAIFDIFRAFAEPEETAAFAREFEQGIAWSDAKEKLFARIDAEIGPMRERYAQLIAKPQHIEDILQAGAQKARAIATPLLHELRCAVGLRAMSAPLASTPEKAAEGAALPVFKQYREADGQFYFRLATPQGQTLLQSKAFQQPREAGQAIARLKKEGAAALAALAAQLEPAPDEAALHAALQVLVQEAAGA